MVLFGGLVLILTHAKVITLLIENSIEGLQLICSGSGPERRGIILWFEHRVRSSLCTSWVWYWLHLSMPLKLGVLRNLSYRSFVRLTCSMFLLQDPSKRISPNGYPQPFKKEKLKSLSTSAAIPMARSTAFDEGPGSGPTCVTALKRLTCFNEACITVWDTLHHHISHGCFLVAQMLFPFCIYSIHRLCLRAL